jgi:hypothetical protein
MCSGVEVWRCVEGQINNQIIYIITVDWIHLAQDRDRWRALVNTVMSFRVP